MKITAIITLIRFTFLSTHIFSSEVHEVVDDVLTRETCAIGQRTRVERLVGRLIHAQQFSTLQTYTNHRKIRAHSLPLTNVALNKDATMYVLKFLLNLHHYLLMICKPFMTNSASISKWSISFLVITVHISFIIKNKYFISSHYLWYWFSGIWCYIWVTI